MINADFKAIGNRDAWATIRGFVYQVDTTISRWIALGANEVLELEKGEDIDIIANDPNGDPLRILEQLKHRESTISLNQRETLEILKNFYLHVENNPGINLRFRFITNTGYNLESPALVSDARKGIDIWKSLAAKQIDPADADFLAIQNHLLWRTSELSVAKPEAKDTELKDTAEWKRFGDHLAYPEKLALFISKFEWATNEPDAPGISSAIVEKLETIYPEHDAKLIYERLFLHMFKLLSQRGTKQLTRKDFLDQAALRALDLSDQAMLVNVQALMSSLAERMDKLQDAVTTQTSRLENLYNEVADIRSDTTFNFRLQTLSSDPPLLITNGTSRESKVKQIISHFERYSWIAFAGLNGCGKTQMASLITRQFEHVHWVDLRTFNGDPLRVALIIESFFGMLSHIPKTNNLSNWVDSVFSTLPENCLLVMNDLPEVGTDNPELYQLLATISNAARKKKVRVLTTSNFGFPSSLINLSTQRSILQYENFEFSDEEIKECLANNNAPQNMERFIQLMADRSYRNPRLILAMIYHLKDMDWGDYESRLNAIAFDSGFSSEVVADAQKNIRNYIHDDDAKELLYRLSLIIWEFNHEELSAISRVLPAVRHPNEKMGHLLHLWIQQHAAGEYFVSPIIRNIGTSNLEPGAVDSVHRAYADAIVARKKLNQASAIRAITSYVTGSAPESAANLLLNFYRSADTPEKAKILDRWGYLSFWNEMLAPEEVPLTTRLFLKMDQLRLSQLLDKDLSPLVATIVAYLDRPEIRDTESLMVKFVLLFQFGPLIPAKYWDYLEFILVKWASFAHRELFNFSPREFSNILWLPVQTLAKKEDLERWLHNIELAIGLFGREILQQDVAATAVGVICNNIEKDTTGAVPDAAETASIVKRIQLLHDSFTRLGYEPLAAVAYREKTHIAYRLSMDLDVTREAIENELKNLVDDQSKFILTAYLGRIYYKNVSKEVALPYVTRAMAFNFPESNDFIEMIQFAAAAYQETDINKSVELSERSVKILQERNSPMILDLIQGLAELAIALWLAGENLKAFETFDELVTGLYESKAEHYGRGWMTLYQLTGHVTGYISSQIKTGSHDIAKGLLSWKPFVGVFANLHNDLSDLYNPNNDAFISAHMAFLADALNLPDKAYHWSKMAFDKSRQSKSDRVVIMVASTCSQYAVIRFKPEEALESSILFTSVKAHMGNSFTEESSFLDELNISSLLQPKPSNKWNLAEEQVIKLTVIPLLIKVMSATLTDKPYAAEWNKRLISTLQEYLHLASNRTDWEIVIELTTNILAGKVRRDQLVNRANNFGEQQRYALQLLCLLGLSYFAVDSDDIFKAMINIAPYFQRLFKQTDAINRFVLLPYIKTRMRYIIEKYHQGTETEMTNRLLELDNISLEDPHAIQKAMQIVVHLIAPDIQEDRKRWLYQFEEI